MRAYLVFVISLAGCIKAGDFVCAGNADCDRAGAQGICQANNFCSFADGSCESGQRFGDFSGNVSQQCVDGSVTGTFAVGGSAAGLAGTLVLANNGGDMLTLTANGDFTFSMRLADAAIYAVTVNAQPANQTCIVNNGSGTIASADVSDIVITCGSTSTSTVLCSTGVECSLATEFCCFDRDVGSGSCQAIGSTCVTQRLECDAAADCGGGTSVCCASYSNQQNLRDAVCESEASACTAPMSGTAELWCDPAAGAAACPAGQTCTGTPIVPSPGFTICE